MDVGKGGEALDIHRQSLKGRLERTERLRHSPARVEHTHKMVHDDPYFEYGHGTSAHGQTLTRTLVPVPLS